jgi:hypothetical protein
MIQREVEILSSVCDTLSDVLKTPEVAQNPLLRRSIYDVQERLYSMIDHQKKFDERKARESKPE